MGKEKQHDLPLMIFCFIILFLGFYGGGQSKKRQIEKRAKEINKECITNQELEYIIFGEIQE